MTAAPVALFGRRTTPVPSATSLVLRPRPRAPAAPAFRILASSWLCPICVFWTATPAACVMCPSLRVFMRVMKELTDWTSYQNGFVHGPIEGQSVPHS